MNLADVELPDGRHLEHYVIRQRPAALATAVNAANEVLLLWRHRFITESWGWELAAGVVEEGEPVAEAAGREMLEETGWRPIGPLRHLVTVEPSNGLSDARHHVYWAEGAEHVGHPVDDFESSRREWVPLGEVPDLIARRRAISEHGRRAADAAPPQTGPRDLHVGSPLKLPVGVAWTAAAAHGHRATTVDDARPVADWPLGRGVARPDDAVPTLGCGTPADVR